jgi:hypothetical protein
MIKIHGNDGVGPAKLKKRVLEQKEPSLKHDKGS